MNSGLFGISATPRQAWLYTSGPYDLTSGSEQQIEFPGVRKLGPVHIYLLCITANNGYEAGELVPIEMVYRMGGADRDGAPRWSWRIVGNVVKFTLASGSVEIMDSTGNVGTFTPGEWQLVIHAQG